MKTTCTKKRFRDEIAAKLALATIQHRDSSKRARTEVRAYEHKKSAGGCGRWHLTSMPREH